MLLSLVLSGRPRQVRPKPPRRLIRSFAPDLTRPGPDVAHDDHLARMRKLEGWPVRERTRKDRGARPIMTLRPPELISQIARAHYLNFLRVELGRTRARGPCLECRAGRRVPFGLREVRD